MIGGLRIVLSVSYLIRDILSCACFVDRCLFFCTFSFGHCVYLFFFDIWILIASIWFFQALFHGFYLLFSCSIFKYYLLNIVVYPVFRDTQIDIII